MALIEFLEEGTVHGRCFLCRGKNNFTGGKVPGPPSTLENFSQLLMSMFQNIFSIQKMFLAELWYESISSGDQYVNLHSTIG
jgi:hypothetical protein